MENMIMLSRMEGIPVPPIAPPPPINKPIPPMPPTLPPECFPPTVPPVPPTTPDCYMPALAMAYVPVQQWQHIYEPEVAFARATLFKELDKPFIGEEVRFV